MKTSLLATTATHRPSDVNEIAVFSFLSFHSFLISPRSLVHVCVFCSSKVLSQLGLCVFFLSLVRHLRPNYLVRGADSPQTFCWTWNLLQSNVPFFNVFALKPKCAIAKFRRKTNDTHSTRDEIEMWSVYTSFSLFFYWPNTQSADSDDDDDDGLEKHKF